MKKNPVNGCAYNFLVDYRVFGIIDITNILKYLMKTWYKITFKLMGKSY